MNEILDQTRRRFLTFFTQAGLSSTLLPGVLWARMQEGRSQTITLAMLKEAERIAGVEFDQQERERIVNGVNENADRFNALRRIPLPNHVPPALRFSPILPGMTFEKVRRPLRPSRAAGLKRPSDLDQLVFWPVLHLAHLIRTRQITSSELTELYLDRLKRYGPALHCVARLTESTATAQALRADREVRAGRIRSLLHGIPWGAKDIIATKNHDTEWGSALYQRQRFGFDATVVERLEAAGAVHVAKLSTGELAYDDVWSDGTVEHLTRNPWEPLRGSGGSSAGPASATAAGLVPFAIGTETGGSIVCPAARCGVTALRPTFGRVSRHGVMTVAWSFDKVGCLCRTVEDGALILDAIHGPDGRDLSVVDLPFNWNAYLAVRDLRIGYLAAAFAEQRPEIVREGKLFDETTLDQLRRLGMQPRPIGLPDLPITEAGWIASLASETSAVWSELVRDRRDQGMTEHAREEFGVVFRAGQLVPAVEYIRANRVRTLLMEEMRRMMTDIDVYVAPISDLPAGAIAEANLALTNLTGYPAVVVPNGFTTRGTPLGISFIGKLYREAELLAVAKAYQDSTTFHQQRPNLDASPK